MYDPYFLRMLMREREREIREELARGAYHASRRSGSPGVSKKIARRLRSALLRFKTIAGSGQSRKQSTDLKGGHELWKKEFS